MAKITNPNVVAYLAEYRRIAEKVRNLAPEVLSISVPYWAEGGINAILASAQNSDTIGDTGLTKAQLVALQSTSEALSTLLNTQGHSAVAHQFIFAVNTESV
jgi:hypothetical protein